MIFYFLMTGLAIISIWFLVYKNSTKQEHPIYTLHGWNTEPMKNYIETVTNQKLCAGAISGFSYYNKYGSYWISLNDFVPLECKRLDASEEELFVKIYGVPSCIECEKCNTRFARCVCEDGNILKAIGG